MKTEEKKTLVIRINSTELEQLALVGIHAIIKTKQHFKLDDAMMAKVKIYGEIRTVCNAVPSELSIAVKDLKLGDYDSVKLVLGK